MAAIDLTMGDGPPEAAQAFSPREARIETDRLVLRRPQACDAVYLADLANDVDVARMTTGVPYPYRLGDAESFIAAQQRGDPEFDRPLLIEHRQFGPVGMTGFHRSPGARYPELGYWLGRAFRGRGLATEAACAAMRWAEGEWGKRAVLSSHFVDNAASARVLAKCGFLYTGDRQARFSRGRGCVVPTRMMVRLA